jgi:hypothetical protein
VRLDELLDEARAAVAAGRDPDWRDLRARIHAAAPDERTSRDALARLERIAAVHRARRVRTTGEPAAPAAPSRPTLLRTRPTLTGNMDLGRDRSGGTFLLSWPGERTVERWELRISQRFDPRGDYEVVEARELPGEATVVEVPLRADAQLRVHLLGRSRDGRLLRRAIASGLTLESWDERFRRRPSAA